MTKALPFTQADVTRALRGAKAAGVPLDRFEIEIHRGSGTIVLRPSRQGGVESEVVDEWSLAIAKQHEAGK